MTSVPINARRGVRLRLLAAAALTASGLAPLAAQAAGRSAEFVSPCPDTPDKCFSASVTFDPASPKPGDRITVTMDVVNEGSGGAGKQLGTVLVGLAEGAYYDGSADDPDGDGPQAASIDDPEAPTEARFYNLNLAPEGVGRARLVFYVHAYQGGTIDLDIKGFQANNANSDGNQLTLLDGNHDGQVSNRCNGFDAEATDYFCFAFDRLDGLLAHTYGWNGEGFTTPVGATLGIPAQQLSEIEEGGPRYLVVELSTSENGHDCPSPVSALPDPAKGLVCSFGARILPQPNQLGGAIPAGYTLEHGWTMTIDARVRGCGIGPVWLQEDETEGKTTLLLPDAVPSFQDPYTGSWMRYHDNGDCTTTVSNFTHDVDVRVMNFNVG